MNKESIINAMLEIQKPRESIYLNGTEYFDVLQNSIRMDEAIIQSLSKHRFSLENEKLLQKQIEDVLRPIFGNRLEREKILDAENIPDFFIDGVCIEVKIKQSKKKIYKQCVRYCEFEVVKSLILVTGVHLGFPKEINGKSCYVLNLSK